MQEKSIENSRKALTQQQIEQIQTIAETIRYGSITLVFQDHELVQIDHSEKIRVKKEK